jgi:hypothetical protein
VTFANILADAYRRVGLQESPDSRAVTRIKAFVNETQQELAGEPGLAQLLRGSMTFATTADRAEEGLPPAVARVVTIREATNNRRLRQESLDWYRWAVPDAAQQTGTPAIYVPLGMKAVQQQPADASSLFVKSTAAGDTTQVLHYEVRVTDGTIRTGSVTLTGTTAVTLSSALTTIEEVLDLYLSAVAVGTVTLHEDSGVGTELARIGIGKTRSTYPWIAFAPTPSAAITYMLDYERDATDLVQDGDEPAWLPVRFHRLLAIGARKKEYEKGDDTRYTAAAQEYDRVLRDLLAYVNNPPDYVLIPGGQPSGYSDLGGHYPPGTIWSR